VHALHAQPRHGDRGRRRTPDAHQGPSGTRESARPATASTRPGSRAPPSLARGRRRSYARNSPRRSRTGAAHCTDRHTVSRRQRAIPIRELSHITSR